MSHHNDQHGHHTKADFEAELTHHDDWFRHSPGEQHQPSHGETNSWAISITLVILCVVTFAIAFYVLNYFQRAVAHEKLIKREQRTDLTWGNDVRQIKGNWNAELEQYRVLDAKAGTVGLPLDVAADRVVSQYAGKAK
jgi:Ca2+/H+ antiporter